MDFLRAIHIGGEIFTLILGTLLHFVWEWSGRSNITAVFSAVNESIWEHLKLLFFPFVIFTFAEYLVYGKHMSCFFTVKMQAVLLGMLAIVVVFYTYTGILGKNYFPLDIGTFVLGVLVSYIYSYRNLSSMANTCSANSELFSFFVIIAFIIAFGIFTFYPPKLGIFIPPEL